MFDGQCKPIGWIGPSYASGGKSIKWSAAQTHLYVASHRATFVLADKDSMLLMCSPFEQKVVTAGQENRPTSLQVSMATAATLGAVEGDAMLSCSTYTK